MDFSRIKGFDDVFNTPLFNTLHFIQRAASSVDKWSTVILGTTGAVAIGGSLIATVVSPPSTIPAIWASVFLPQVVGLVAGGLAAARL